MAESQSQDITSTPWAVDGGKLAGALDVDPGRGLSAREARQRRRQYGPNTLAQRQRRGVIPILVDQFKSLVIGLLAVAAVVSLVYGRFVEAIAIGIAILINTVIGFLTELKAVKSMDALRKMSRTTARVRRDGEEVTLPSKELVPGDVVLLEAGALVPADLRLIKASQLQADESTLTGESVPVDKTTDPVEEGVELPERKSMLFKGTGIARGDAEGIVTATGRQTEFGQISELVEQAEDETTPLEKRLNHLAYRLVWITLALCVVVVLAGVVQGKEVVLMIESAVALAVAAIPEGLPIVATVALARGMLRMARRNALINRLAAVETLGSTSVIGTDKTGTLTENRMTVTTLVTSRTRYETGDESRVDDSDSEPFEVGDGQEGDRQDFEQAMKVAVLCNNAKLADNEQSESDEQGENQGDPLELALLRIGTQLGMNRTKLLKEYPEQREEPFTSDTMMMATFHEDLDGGYLVAVKGAPEAVLESCEAVAGNGTRALEDDTREHWQKTNRELAADGLRVLALASKEAESVEDDPYDGLTLLGLIGMVDPPREDVAQAISDCQQAGIRVVMMTGDQPETARAVARAIGLVKDGDDLPVITGRELAEYEEGDSELSEDQQQRLLGTSIFARVNPRQKLILIHLHQANDSVVAMTGDGVNDAPALKSADIGVAMGKRGTQVAQEASDMVLRDDAFPTIVSAIRYGRGVFENIRKFCIYLFSGNAAEILAVAAASLVKLPLPLLPLQILFLNFVLDVFPALALGFGETRKGVMKEPPRPIGESFLAGRHWVAIAVFGVIISAPALGALTIGLYVLGLPQDQAVTVSFLAIALSRLWHVLNMRSDDTTFWSNEIVRNRHVWAAVALCAVLIVGVVHVPGLSRIMELASPPMAGWFLALGASVVPLIVGQILKGLRVISTT
jgi:Ca2+-transporting ATPase